MARTIKKLQTKIRRHKLTGKKHPLLQPGYHKSIEIYGTIYEDHARKALATFRREIPGYRYSIRKIIRQDKDWKFMQMPYSYGQITQLRPYKEPPSIWWQVRVHPPLRGFIKKLEAFHKANLSKKETWER